MSYTKDDHSYTRGVGAIAAMDAHSPARRIATARAAQIMARRDAIMARHTLGAIDTRGGVDKPAVDPGGTGGPAGGSGGGAGAGGSPGGGRRPGGRSTLSYPGAIMTLVMPGAGVPMTPGAGGPVFPGRGQTGSGGTKTPSSSGTPVGTSVAGSTSTVVGGGTSGGGRGGSGSGTSGGGGSAGGSRGGDSVPPIEPDTKDEVPDTQGKKSGKMFIWAAIGLGALVLFGKD
jgi:hypothetical protein